MTASSIQQLIKTRTSIRGYKGKPIPQAQQDHITSFIDDLASPPLGTPVRIQWLSGQTESNDALRRLGTYGMIKSPAGYIVGAVANTPVGVVDFGYQVELIVLELTRLGLGSCWLGGSFTKSRFAQVMDLQPGEVLPAVISVGLPLDKRTMLDRLTRRSAGSDQRNPWNDLFFAGNFETPLPQEQAGDYTVPLEMLRLAPSASNRQPWRVVLDGDKFHFYVQRHPSYHRMLKSLKLADLQRLDVGIAMSHFEMTARELGLKGQWTESQTQILLPDAMTEYVATWQQA